MTEHQAETPPPGSEVSEEVRDLRKQVDMLTATVTELKARTRFPRRAASPEALSNLNKQVKVLMATVAVLVAGDFFLWTSKKLLGVTEGAVLITLLALPMIAYLAVSGRLKELKFGSSSVAFTSLEDKVGAVQDTVETVQQSVKTVGRSGPDRSTYLGKLAQVVEKDGDDFCLIYGDVDGLRKLTRQVHLSERAGRPVVGGDRRADGQIRQGIVDRLELALTDAFYDKSPENTKCDIFRLEDPDIAMIVRGVGQSLAGTIAEHATGLFDHYMKDDATKSLPRDGRYSATLIVHPGSRHPPDELDAHAASKLKAEKKSKRGLEARVDPSPGGGGA